MRAGPGREYYPLFRPIFPLFSFHFFFQSTIESSNFVLLLFKKTWPKNFTSHSLSGERLGIQRFWLSLTCENSESDSIAKNWETFLFLDMNGCEEIGTRFLTFLQFKHQSDCLSSILTNFAFLGAPSNTNRTFTIPHCRIPTFLQSAYQKTFHSLRVTHLFICTFTARNNFGQCLVSELRKFSNP